ncbi:3'(2'),5'-bisphosphate nucleotidase CysQ [Ferruginivarius sediminum]|uniref:3'(2'),5'-bisphosphate nucleotidase CysQ n=1 Tax=Ferruginivarius sediminum TaxID=2661937 RepID=A0A369T606_9PROT|nr:3'(2'),5'-bisphosphate nucleotidase CysQ [Ferruginivarius sediminum]RDD60698.1 3'(2'),5'-bisphosphate nucleotidase [Ferruginivarius sediminum]
MTEATATTKEDLDDLLGVIRTIAERAGKEILAYYVEGEEIEVTEKADKSPLTQADLAADRLITKALETLTPDVPVISEEGVEEGRIPKVDRRFWLVDPLDGTKEFLSRNGEFTVNIALVEDGRPVAGVVHAPALAMTWCGAVAPDGSRHATFSETDQKTMNIEARTIPAEGATVVASRRHGDPEQMKAFLGGQAIADTRNAGSSIKFCLVANGKADIYPRFGRTMEWDTAAGHAVLAAAGGRVETVDGQPLTYGKPDFANPEFVAYGKG